MDKGYPVDTQADAAALPPVPVADGGVLPPPRISSIESLNNSVVRGSVGKGIRVVTSENARTVAIGLEGDPGYWLIPVAAHSIEFAPDLELSAALDFDRSLPVGKAKVWFAASDAEGRYGPARALELAILDDVPSAPLVVSLSWTANFDLDLLIVQPDGKVITNKAVRSATDGALAAKIDLDSNSACVFDGHRKENALFRSTPPGEYQVYVRLASSCGLPTTGWTVRLIREGVELDRASGVSYAYEPICPTEVRPDLADSLCASPSAAEDQAVIIVRNKALWLVCLAVLQGPLAHAQAPGSPAQVAPPPVAPPSAPAASELPPPPANLPPADDIPPLPDMPGMPAADDIPPLPDMPGLPPADDIPPLPDMPGLPPANDMPSGAGPQPAQRKTAAGDDDAGETVVRVRRRARAVTSTRTSVAEAKRLPGTQGDAIRVIESLPGVGRPSFASGELLLWGASPDASRIYVDGVPVPRLFHGGGLRSVLQRLLRQGDRAACRARTGQTTAARPPAWCASRPRRWPRVCTVWRRSTCSTRAWPGLTSSHRSSSWAPAFATATCRASRGWSCPTRRCSTPSSPTTTTTRRAQSGA